MSLIKILFLIAIIGHILCGVCDCLLTYVPGGKFSAEQLSDNDKLKATFSKMPLKNPLLSMLLGVLAMLMFSAGYYGIYLWLKEYSVTLAVIVLISSAVFIIPGVAHHVFCGAAEWFYIKMGMTEEARQTIIKFFKDTSSTMIVCYLGMAVFAVTLFIAVVTGKTDLPRWACIFNSALLYIPLFPLRIGGTGNWVGAIMFLGLFALI
ncbi:MAG: hypothetical protein IJR15_02095 [Clostridiales bacterium]|nr:hypothetical protein [Clostridiales bacterium]